MMKRVLLILVGVAAGAGIVVLLDRVGVPAEFAAAWLLLIVAVGLLSRAGLPDDGSWPPARPERRPRGSEVARLSWNINSRTGEAGFLIVRRVERVLRHRLARLGIDLDDPDQSSAVDDLLGAGIRDTFARAEVTRADLERVMTAIDRLPTPTNQER
ncbi:hypothetical protein [Microbacterium kyungheense]|uniref:Uncharacterized protein n=1 Tax=Microbacterium kyungheense TaxID=1263636 RepID=A0A543FMB4_9MICO|nr:hypothetical protein [Microbacterium kyungheense]TQM34991.1 hypothetical protein FB391_1287 [Microbacterium kyungheense]